MKERPIQSPFEESVKTENRPSNIYVSINKFLAEKKSILVVPQPPYSADLSPCDFFLFPPAQKPLERAPFWYFG